MLHGGEILYRTLGGLRRQKLSLFPVANPTLSFRIQYRQNLRGNVVNSSPGTLSRASSLLAWYFHNSKLCSDIRCTEKCIFHGGCWIKKGGRGIKATCEGWFGYEFSAEGENLLDGSGTTRRFDESASKTNKATKFLYCSFFIIFTSCDQFSKTFF